MLSDSDQRLVPFVLILPVSARTMNGASQFLLVMLLFFSFEWQKVLQITRTDTELQ